MQLSRLGAQPTQVGGSVAPRVCGSGWEGGKEVCRLVHVRCHRPCTKPQPRHCSLQAAAGLVPHLWRAAAALAHGGCLRGDAAPL
eukprot:90796-Chlamydomonas_euryale.AAC.2